jgi:alpha-L-rhamnosidase
VTVPVVPRTSIKGAVAVWGDVAIINPWNAYLMTGDLDMLREEYAGAKAWLDQGIPRNEIGLWNRSTFQYGDWLDPQAPTGRPEDATTKPTYVADAYLVYVTGLVAKMGIELGLNEASYYSKWTSDLKQKFLDAWVTHDGVVAYETQTGLTLPLYFDLFPNEEQAWAAAARLEKIIIDNEHLVGTGFAGTHLLGLSLTKYKLTHTFYKMLLQTTVPSWLYQVVMKGTTTWERWDSMLPDGSLNPQGATSFNHYAFGSVANWMHGTIGGLAPAEPGWRTVDVAPVPGGGITHASASYVSAYGRVATRWNVGDGHFHLSLEVPPNTKALVRLPGCEGPPIRVGSGTHQFLIQGEFGR